MKRILPTVVAEDALRIVYQLQFAGRQQAFPRPEPSSEIRASLVKTGKQSYFETVPILAVLAEFYTPEKRSYLDYRDLSVAVTYLHRRGFIELVDVKGGDACTWPGFNCDVESALGCYFRPDGAPVANWWNACGKISEIRECYFGGHKKLIEEEYSWHGRVWMTGIVVDGHPLYWRFSRTGNLKAYPRPDDPAFTLDCPAEMSGFPRNKNYVMTATGIGLIEPTITRQFQSYGPPEGSKPRAVNKGCRSKRRKLEWLSNAMLTIGDHPDWSNNKIAKYVGVAPSTLSRSKEYQRAAAMARGIKSDVRPGFLKTDDDGQYSDVDGVTSQEFLDDIEE